MTVSTTRPSNQLAERGMPTLSDVAALAGVSKVSASVALNGAKSGTVLSDATRQRILMAAEELGYKRNGSMASARVGRFGSVALLLSTDENRSHLPARLWDGIHDELARHDLHLTVSRLPDEKLTDEGVVPKILREWMCDGLLIDYTNHIPQKMLDLIQGHQLPAVWINSQQKSDCVYPDDLGAGRWVTEHLVKLGHTRIGYADFTYVPEDPNEHYSGRARRAGYVTAMEKAGFAPQILPYLAEAERSPFCRDLLRRNDAPTALICYGDIETGLFMMAAASLGKSIPRDVSLVSFVSPGASLNGYLLSGASLQQYEVGRRAAQLLREKIARPMQAFDPQTITFDWEEGQTCGLPRFTH